MKKQPNLITLFTMGLFWVAPLSADTTPLYRFDVPVPAEIELGRSTEVEVKTVEPNGQVSRRTVNALVDITNRNGTESRKISIKNGKGKLVLRFDDAADQGVIIVKISNEDGSVFNTAGSRVRSPLRVLRGTR